MFDLKPEFEHFAVPGKVESVFMKAKLKNTSEYLILSGPTSIFVDNNFVAKVALRVQSLLKYIYLPVLT